MLKQVYIIALFIFFHRISYTQQSNAIAIIPQPSQIEVGTGFYSLGSSLTIQALKKEELHVASFVENWLLSRDKSVTIVAQEKAQIRLIIDDSITEHPEGYGLKVGREGIVIRASSGAGLFYGVQTLMQLLPLEQGIDDIPYASIVDEPAFVWRGSMLDVSRHFFPVSFIKKYIDMLAMYKINTFHWHLTDDQGWRIEIKKYPKLTEVGAFRKETLIGEEQLVKKAGGNYVYDGIPYGGFYTQKEIKEIVAYAQARYVNIVPEIEMPGHTSAVLAAYPELACKPGNYEVGSTWGVYQDIICPTEKSIRFFKNVLEEVTELFPGDYVHIGGDEAPKEVWKESKEVHKIMKENKIHEVEKVQGWFNRKMEEFLQSKGKKLIGWDEILEGGISNASTVMSWRGEVGGIEAASHGNDVVMSPHNYVYLDYGQNIKPYSPYEPIMICCYLPIEQVYNYNPLPNELAKEKHKHILGVQANLWTEYITTAAKAEYALFPRLLALSEIAWVPSERKDYSHFMKKISAHFSRLDEQSINYRIPSPTGLSENKIAKKGNKVQLSLESIVPRSTIHYTLDGHMPDETSSIYTQPIVIPIGRNIRVRAITLAPNRRKSAPVEYVVQ